MCTNNHSLNPMLENPFVTIQMWNMKIHRSMNTILSSHNVHIFDHSMTEAHSLNPMLESLCWGRPNFANIIC